MVQGPGGVVLEWDWDAFRRLPAVDVTVDLHCVTGWSKLDTEWRAWTARRWPTSLDLPRGSAV
jgi:DMSO/TMAO reductase YedYZ molybdopterin-dependent catalytic subunit